MAKTHRNRTEYQRKWRANNKERMAEHARRFKEKNPQRVLAYSRKYHAAHKKQRAAWRRRNRGKINAANKKRFAASPEARMRRNLSSRIPTLLKRSGARKPTSTISLLGLPIALFRQYIETLWQPGMSWANYGPTGWHIDHKMPVASFDLTDPIKVRACFHFTNLQPLWWRENVSKSSRLSCGRLLRKKANAKS